MYDKHFKSIATMGAIEKAAKHGHTEFLKELLRTVKLPDSKWGDKALSCAIYKKHSDCVELLIKAGAQTNVPSLLNTIAPEYGSHSGSYHSERPYLLAYGPQSVEAEKVMVVKRELPGMRL